MKQSKDSQYSDSMHLVPVTSWSEWDSALELSDQRSIFLKSSYLKMCGLTDAARLLSLQGEIIGGVVIPEITKSIEVIEIRDFAIVGIKSPLRGSCKATCNPKPKLYFQVEIN